jgi:2'-5' RNA ligase
MLAPPKRLFIGLIPDRITQMAIQRHCRLWHWPEGCVPTRFGRYHLTLHFLGDQGPGIEARLRRALGQVRLPPLQLELARPQVWRNHVAVLRPCDDAAVRALQETLATAAKLAAANHFEPHVTLAYQAAAAQPPIETRPITWQVREFALVWSRLYPEVKPSRYEIIESFGLRAQGEWTPERSRHATRSQMPLF